MKNVTKLLWLSITLGTMSLAMSGCQKEGYPQTDLNRVVQGGMESKENAPILVFFAGHDGTNCPGCIIMGGKRYHVDCQGAGTKCAISTKVTIEQNGTNFTATTTDTFDLTSEDFFMMPDRSLYYETDENNNRIFLNIPAQLVLRDTVTQQFTFTGLSFSEGPIY